MTTELSVVEKALGKGDLAGQRAPLEQIVKALRSLRLKSLEDLDLATRGKLITTLMRVQRQPRPVPSVEPAGAVGVGEPAEGAAPGAAGEPGPGEVPAGPEALSVMTPPGVAGNVPGETEVGISEGSPELTAEQAKAQVQAPRDEKTAAYEEVMQLVGRAWRAAGAQDRAEVAFSLSGRPAPQETEPAPAPREEREARGEERPRRERGERAPREGRERPPREAREGRERAPREARERPPREAREGRERAPRAPREAAPAAPVVLNETQQALQAALQAGETENARKLAAQLKAEEARPLLEKAQAWELLMELYVRAGDFDSVARLYERARQFDQAALAWERAGKLTPARKAYERARDFHSANRVRRLEVQRLVEKGDRLGAATLLMAAGLRAEAADVITTLPAPKAFHFLQRVKLDEEAQALAQRELARAEAENKPVQRARWLETLGQTQAAAEAYEAAGRKDRASAMYEQLGSLPRAAELAEAAGQRERAITLFRQAGDTASAERLAALPPPAAPAAPPAEPEESEQQSESSP